MLNNTKFIKMKEIGWDESRHLKKRFT